MTNHRITKPLDNHYEPGNCEWTTKAGQARNRETNVWIDTCRGRMLVYDAAKLAGVDHRVMRGRVARGITGEALFAPGERSHYKASRQDGSPAPA